MHQSDCSFSTVILYDLATTGMQQCHCLQYNFELPHNFADQSDLRFVYHSCGGVHANHQPGPRRPSSSREVGSGMLLELTTALDIGVHNLRLDTIGSTLVRCKSLEEILYEVSIMNNVITEFMYNH